MQEEKPKAIFAAILSVMHDVEGIGKNQKNQAQGYNFRGVEAAYNALNPCMAKHGVFTTSEILSRESDSMQTKSGGTMYRETIHARYHFWAADGSSVSADAIGQAMDSGDKAANKAMSFAHKYALMQTFLVPFMRPDDGDFDSPMHEGSKEAAQAVGKRRIAETAIPKSQPTDLNVSQQDVDAIVAQRAAEPENALIPPRESFLLQLANSGRPKLNTAIKNLMSALEAELGKDAAKKIANDALADAEKVSTKECSDDEVRDICRKMYDSLPSINNPKVAPEVEEIWRSMTDIASTVTAFRALREKLQSVLAAGNSRDPLADTEAVYREVLTKYGVKHSNEFKGDKTQAGRQAIADLWGFYNAARKAAGK